MTALVRYDEACRAVQAASTIDDAKDIADKAVALKAYARQSKNPALHQWIAEIELRAKRRIGELTKDLEKGTPKNGHRHELPTSGKFKKDALADAGISLSEANRCEQIAAVPAAKFEAVLAEHKESGKPVTAEAVVRRATKAEKPKPAKQQEAATVPLSKYEALEKKHAQLIEKYDELTEQLETYTSIADGDAAKDMQTLKASLAQANRARDDKMRLSSEKQKQIDSLTRELKKLGWKGFKK